MVRTSASVVVVIGGGGLSRAEPRLAPGTAGRAGLLREHHLLAERRVLIDGVLGDRPRRRRVDLGPLVGGGDAAVLGDRLGRRALGLGDVETVVEGGDAAVLDHGAGVVVGLGRPVVVAQ